MIERRTLLDLIAALVDPDPCRYDHHDLCQAHSLDERPCPHERAKEVLKLAFDEEQT